MLIDKMRVFPYFLQFGEILKKIISLQSLNIKGVAPDSYRDCDGAKTAAAGEVSLIELKINLRMWRNWQPRQT